MLDRPPAAADRKRARQRELHRLAERRRRARERNGERVYPVSAGEVVHAALIARNIDAGLSVEAAEADACNPAKVKCDLDDVVLQWARRYLAERQKNL